MKLPENEPLAFVVPVIIDESSSNRTTLVDGDKPDALHETCAPMTAKSGAHVRTGTLAETVSNTRGTVSKLPLTRSVSRMPPGTCGVNDPRAPNGRLCTTESSASTACGCDGGCMESTNSEILETIAGSSGVEFPVPTSITVDVTVPLGGVNGKSPTISILMILSIPRKGLNTPPVVLLESVFKKTSNLESTLPDVG